MTKPATERGYVATPATKRRLWLLLWGLCALSVLLELVTDRTPHFPVEGVFGFYALVGFLACLACIIFARGLGFFLKKRPDYYDDDDA